MPFGYWIKWMSGPVIRAGVPYTVHQSQNRLVDRSRLDAIMLEHCPKSETPLANQDEKNLDHGLSQWTIGYKTV